MLLLAKREGGPKNDYRRKKGRAKITMTKGPTCELLVFGGGGCAVVLLCLGQ